MASNAPTNELIKFLETGVQDAFPRVYNAGNTSIATRYTKVWAEYYNKIRNFIGIVEPLCTTETAHDYGVSGITHWTLNPAPSLYDIMYGSAKKAYDQGFAPPTTIFPFEIVITSSLDNYSSWPKLSGGAGTVPMLFQASSTNINKIVRGDISTIKPMVQCTIKSSNPAYYSTRWSVNSYCISSADTLLIRGSIIDVNGTAAITTSLPPISSSFPDGALHFLNVALVGVRT